MKKVWTHQILDLPPVPKEFVDLASTGDPSKWGTGSRTSWPHHGRDYARRDLVRNGNSVEFVPIRRYGINEDFEQWVKQNIISEFTEATIGITDTVVSNIGDCGPHVDRYRDYVLLYTIQRGGPNQRTTFYKEKDQPIIRDRSTAHIYADNYDQIDLIERADFVLYRWILLDGRILHSIENLVEPRINFQIAIDRSFDELTTKTDVLPACTETDWIASNYKV